MKKQDLELILSEHKKWLVGDGGSKANLRRADLRGANLRGADLRGANLRWADLRVANLREADLRWANLRWADLRGADLRWADLRGADLDYSCWPLWCGGLDVKIDDKIAIQLLYHVVRCVLYSPYTTKGLKKALSTKTILKFANEFHRQELPRIKVGGDEE